MGKAEKLLARLLSLPRDFTWDELTAVMSKHGFVLHKGSGSGRKFLHRETGIAVTMHEPHPGKTLKRYQLQDVIEGLRKSGVVDDE